MLQLASIFFAMFAGYANRLSIRPALLNNMLTSMIVIILMVMGYDFGSKAANILLESLQLAKMVMTFTFMLLIFNCIAVYGFAKFNDSTRHANSASDNRGIFSWVMESAKYLAYVLTGIIFGYMIKWPIPFLNPMISFLLCVTMFIIGHQLRAQGVSLKKVLANRKGMVLAMIVVCSSLLAGLACTWLLHLRLNEGLMLASGYGWYTLSGILSGQLINHYMGAASFFIDFFREIIAIVLIPLFGRTNPLPLIGYSGATALDFTLPVIRIHMGEEAVPVAITSGMILTLLVPLMIPLLFSLFGG